MVDPDRRPTAQEIEELIDLVRRDPASPAFIDLGEAYLALGRPRDAMQVGNVGLGAAPDSLEGRVMLARAYAAMHQWKEAQGELLRVVKVDRGSRAGFALLGEVLLRRQDFERAVPVLQHAQNLDPTSPQILAMLKRARSGQLLDPPAPIPTPVPPRGETDNGQQILRSSKPSAAAMAPTLVPGAAVAPPNLRPRASAASAASPAMPMVPTASPAMPTMAVEPAPDWRSEPATEAAPPPSFADASAGMSRAPRSAPQAAAAPVSVEGVRPRIVQAAKPQNAAAASLRQSAAVGESYLNELLTGGLLDVAGVRVPDADFDLRPDRRWGRSTRRAFVFLFVVLVLGIGGGGTWYWWSEKQKAETVARLQRESQAAIALGDHAGFETCVKKLGDALKYDKTSLLTYAYFAQCAGLDALLYGTDPDSADNALKIAREVKPDQPGAREVLIGRAAVELAQLGLKVGAPGSSQTAIAQVAKTTLAEQRKALDAFGDKHDADRWVKWLRGRALLAAGERKAARANLKAAADGDDGLVVAMIDTADLLVDDGQLDDALAVYDRAAARVKEHPLAKDQQAKPHPLVVVGRVLGRVEAAQAADETLGELSVGLTGTQPPRLQAYRDLALALAAAVTQDNVKAKETLQKATGGSRPPNEPRFWARVAWAYLLRGDVAGTTGARSRIVWFGQGKAEDDPAVQLVDAGLLLAAGLPEKALALAERLQGVRPQLLRAYAELDLGKPRDALKEADGVLKKSPDSIEAKILREQARMESTEGKERSEATDALEKVARQARSKIGLHALGAAHFANGNLKEAQSRLEQAVADLSDDTPNPLAYRSYTTLAEILLANGDLPAARKQAEAAVKLNPGYFPATGLLARVAVRQGEAERGLELLQPMFAELKDAVPAAMQLVYAEAVATRKGATADDRATAIAVVKKVRDQVPQPELSRAAAAIDPKLPKELGIPEPTAPDAARPAEPKRPKRR